MRYFVILVVFFVSQALAYRGHYKKYWEPRRPKCEPLECGLNCKEVPKPEGCPACECDLRCSEPKCLPPCKLETKIGAPCPVCECSKEDEILSEGSLDIGKPQCSPPNCPPGCEIEKVFQGPCPGCECKKKEEIPGIDKPICDPVNCDAKCRQEIGPSGCPHCVCDPLCSPPKCPLGCEIEIEFEGPCPGCKCDEKIPEEKPICDPPKCDIGCELEKEPKGICPVCVCKDEIKDVIAEKKDEEEVKDIIIENKDDEILDEGIKEDCPKIEDCSKPDCALKEDEKGCEVCQCGPICDPPKCPWRCQVKEVEGKCPECVCNILRFGKGNKSR